MDQTNPGPLRGRIQRGGVSLGLRELLHELLAHVNRNYSRNETLRRICSSLLQFSGCDLLCIRLDEDGKTTRCRALAEGEIPVQIVNCSPDPEARASSADKVGEDPIPDRILEAILAGSFATPTQSLTRGRSFWTGDAAQPIQLRDSGGGERPGRTVIIAGEYPSLASILIPIDERTRGILFLASRRRDFFEREDIQAYEAVAETVGVALAHQGAQWALRERVKELTCLYGIDKVASRPGVHLDEFLKEIVELLPPGWQYPEITSARIVLGNRTYLTANFSESAYLQSAEIQVDDQPRGRVDVCYSEERPELDEGPFLKEERKLIDAVAETIGRQVAHHEAQWALRERVKELTCLYGIAKVASRPGVTLNEFLAEIVQLLPAGWQYPELTQARITLDQRAYASTGFRESPYLQVADIVVNDATRGLVEVIYTQRTRDFDEGPFLKEERSLIDEIARQVALVVEHWETEQEASRLQEQLRHADRLATVGQLSAGVAHELNEPISAILGFAQLIKSAPELSDQIVQDVDKIVNAALHTREVIRKLMIYTRQMPARRSKCDLSQVVKEAMYFLDSRCAKEGITLVRDLQGGLPPIIADPSQLYQVLMNLGVNAIQAMPNGGQLTISTRAEAGNVCLTVEDTGIGMDPEVQSRLFLPFFTTKDVGQGTGLGLAVVHGIVVAHGGTIQVKSEVGQGSRFEVYFPIAGRGQDS